MEQSSQGAHTSSLPIGSQKDVITKAIQLFTDKHSVHMFERHVKALERIPRTCTHGFFLSDVPELCVLVALCMNQPDYEDALCSVVRVCRNPFLKQKASDEAMFGPSTVELLSLFGRLLGLDGPQMKKEIAEVVMAFFSEVPDNPLLEGLQVTKLSFNIAIVEKSRIATSFTNVLSQCTDPDLRLLVLKTLRILSSTEFNCQQILSASGATTVCLYLNEDLTDPQHQLMSCSLDILWNLLEKGSKEELNHQLSNVQCVSALRDSFRHVMVSSVSSTDRQLRNDHLVVCSLIAASCPGAPFVGTGFLRELCLFATFTEVNRPNEKLVRNLKLTDRPEDFELKKIMMSLLPSFIDDGASLQVISSHMVLLFLFSYVMPNEKSEMHWTPAQFEELQLLALSVLTSIAPRCMEDYSTCQGSTRLLIMLEWCLQDGPYAGYGNSYHGEGGKGTRIAQLRHCLRLLVSVMSFGDAFIHNELCDQGAIPILTDLLGRYLEEESDFSALSIEMQTDAIVILSHLCDEHMHIKELFGESKGIEILVEYLRADVKKFTGGLGYQKLLIAVVDCVWSSVVGNFKNEDIFLEHEGMFLLLDLLEVCPSNMQSPILGVIVDLCENIKAVPHTTSWRGKQKSSIWSLMAHLWRVEEEEIKVTRGFMHTIGDVCQPLAGEAQRLEGVTDQLVIPSPSKVVPPAIKDVSDNLRAKIFSLCSKIGFQFCPHGLPTEDKVTIYIIERYLDFKTGEVWDELVKELEQEGLEPVPFDQKLLEEVTHITEAKAEQVLETQHQLIEKSRDKESHEEEEFYDQIKQYHLQEEREEEVFEEYLKRTSDYQHLKTSKLRRDREIDASKARTLLMGDRFHSTEVDKLNVTAFSGRKVTVSTTPMKLTSTMGVDHEQSADKPLLATWNASEYGRTLMGH